jgi:hypothetical protein
MDAPTIRATEESAKGEKPEEGNTLSITETIYRRKIRPFGKTPGSMTKTEQDLVPIPHNHAAAEKRSL